MALCGLKFLSRDMYDDDDPLKKKGKARFGSFWKGSNLMGMPSFQNDCVHWRMMTNVSTSLSWI